MFSQLSSFVLSSMCTRCLALPFVPFLVLSSRCVPFQETEPVCDTLADTRHSRQFADAGKDLLFPEEVADAIEGLLV